VGSASKCPGKLSEEECYDCHYLEAQIDAIIGAGHMWWWGAPCTRNAEHDSDCWFNSLCLLCNNL